MSMYPFLPAGVLANAGFWKTAVRATVVVRVITSFSAATAADVVGTFVVLPRGRGSFSGHIFTPIKRMIFELHLVE